MKTRRFKKVHKHLKFFENNYGFHKPYQVLIDGTICYAALKLLMDTKFRKNGRLIDIVDDDWRLDQLPHEDIQVPTEELPDLEADNADSHLTIKEQSQRWLDNLPDPSFPSNNFHEQINLKEQLPKYFGSELKLITTRCIIEETRHLAHKIQGALNIMKLFGIHKCNHKEPVTGTKCIIDLIGVDNSNHYIVGTQDRSLQEKIRKKPGVPIFYLHNKCPTLEGPSQASFDKINKSVEVSTMIPKAQHDALNIMKSMFGMECENPALTFSSKKRKSYNPNPLSCKKKKK